MTRSVESPQLLDAADDESLDMPVNLFANFAMLVDQVQGVQTLRNGMERLSNWADQVRSATTESVQSVTQVVANPRQFMDLLGGKVSDQIDYERRAIRLRASFLERSARILTSLNLPQTAASEESFGEAGDRLRVASEMMRKMKFDEAAVKIQAALDRAEKSLARGHAEILFADPELSSLLLAHALGPHGEDLHRREVVLEKIEREGLEGYLNFLIAALNQHWTPVHSLESMRERFGDQVDEEMWRHHRNGTRTVLGLLGAIERDRLIRTRFRSRWETFSRMHTLEDVRTTANQAFERDEVTSIQEKGEPVR